MFGLKSKLLSYFMAFDEVVQGFSGTGVPDWIKTCLMIGVARRRDSTARYRADLGDEEDSTDEDADTADPLASAVTSPKPCSRSPGSRSSRVGGRRLSLWWATPSRSTSPSPDPG